MAAATTTKSNGTTPTTEMPAFAQKLREQLVSAVQQSQQMSVDAAQTWVKAVSFLPIMDMPNLPGIPALPGLEAVTRFGFDVAADLLSAQRDFALQLTNALVPAKTV